MQKTVTKRVRVTKPTINDILTHDDVNAILRDVSSISPQIDSIIVIHTNRNDNKTWHMRSAGLNTAETVFLLEDVKRITMMENDKDGDGTPE